MLRGRCGKGAQAGDERDVFELADFDEAQMEAGLGDEAALHAARGADEENLGVVAGDEFAGHGQRRNDVAAGAAAGDENAQVGHSGAALVPFLRHGFMREIGEAGKETHSSGAEAPHHFAVLCGTTKVVP